MKKILNIILATLLALTPVMAGSGMYYFGADMEHGYYEHSFEAGAMGYPVFTNEAIMEGSDIHAYTEFNLEMSDIELDFQQNLYMGDTVIGEYGAWFYQEIDPFYSGSYQEIEFRAWADGSSYEPDSFEWNEVIDFEYDGCSGSLFMTQYGRGDADRVVYHDDTHVNIPPMQFDHYGYADVYQGWAEWAYGLDITV